MGFLPRHFFLVDLYHETLGPGVDVGSYPFPFEIRFSLISLRNPVFVVARDQASILGVNLYCPQKIVDVFCLQMKILRATHLFPPIV